MKQINFNPPKNLTSKQNAWWSNWLQSANNETAKAIAAWEASGGKTKPKFNKATWTKLKDWLSTNVFNNTCAFCEIDLGKTRAPGHAEHFRPKSGIKNKDEDEERYVAGKAENPDGESIDHPGYFWLAYNWKNLLPSCNDCNTGPGKKNQFPTDRGYILTQKLTSQQVTDLSKNGQAPIPSNRWKGHYYLDPEHLDLLEGRQILHPYFDNPREHIKFGQNGLVTAKKINGVHSKDGANTIKVFALDADGLNAARWDAQWRAYDDYMFVFNGEIRRKNRADIARSLAHKSYQEHLKKNPVFSAAVHAYMSAILRTLGKGTIS